MGQPRPAVRVRTRLAAAMTRNVPELPDITLYLEAWERRVAGQRLEKPTGGKLLADPLLSRLLKGDWPKTIDRWEERSG